MLTIPEFKVAAVISYTATMAWTVMIDESGTDGTSPIVTMAALLAVDDRWAQLESEWRAMLARHGLPAIHCRELRHQLGYDNAKLGAVMADAETIIGRHVPLSVVSEPDEGTLYTFTRL